MTLTPARLFPVLALSVMLAGCGDGDADTAANNEAPEAASSEAPAPAGEAGCSIEGLQTPVPGRLFVVDGGETPPGAEPGRESIRRVDIHVPGPVSLLLTAPDATVWMLRPSRHTQLNGIYASGDESQRIAGLNLGEVRVERSTAMADPCAGYRMAAGETPELGTLMIELFGRPQDAVYRLAGGRVDIGVPEAPPTPRPREAEPVDPAEQYEALEAAGDEPEVESAEQ